MGISHMIYDSVGWPLVTLLVMCMTILSNDDGGKSTLNANHYLIADIQWSLLHGLSCASWHRIQCIFAMRRMWSNNDIRTLSWSNPDINCIICKEVLNTNRLRRSRVLLEHSLSVSAWLLTIDAYTSITGQRSTLSSHHCWHIERACKIQTKQ